VDLMREKIAKLFLSLGIPPCLKGFQAGVCAIEIILEYPNVMDQITKRLYPEVAKRMGSTASRVERAIRHAVEVMFDYQDYDRIIQLLGLEVNVRTGRYRNSEFLSLCALKLRRLEA